MIGVFFHHVTSFPMKQLFLCFVLYFLCNYSFSQEKTIILSNEDISNILKSLPQEPYKYSNYTYEKNETKILNINLKKQDSLLPIFVNQRISQVNHDYNNNHYDAHILTNKSSDKKVEVFLNNIQDKYIQLYSNEDDLNILDEYYKNPLSLANINSYLYTTNDHDSLSLKIYFSPKKYSDNLVNGYFTLSNSNQIKEIEIRSLYEKTTVKQIFDISNDSINLLSKEVLNTDLLTLNQSNQKTITLNRNSFFYNYSFKNFHHTIKWKNSFKSNFYDENNKLLAIHKNNSELNEIYNTIENINKNVYYNTLAHALYTATKQYIKFPYFEFGNVLSLVNYNRIEGTRFQIGGKTNFSENDKVRLEGYTAYATKDKKFKHAYNLSILLNNDLRLITRIGYRDDVDLVGMHLSPTINILGKNTFTNSFLFGKYSTNYLTYRVHKNLTVEASPWKNIKFSIDFNQNIFKSASENFSIAYINDNNQIANEVNQYEINHSISLSPWRNTYGSGVDLEEIYKGQYKLFFNYSYGIKGLTNNDFDYKRLQLLFYYPLHISKWIKLNITTELGKTYGKVPLSLLHIFPANQSYFGQTNTFNLLNYYEFVADQYATLTVENSFNGFFLSKIPGLEKMNWTEYIGIKTAWGDITDKNINLNKSNIVYYAPNKEVYKEFFIGIGNIFKVLRIDVNFRGNYFYKPNTEKINIKAILGVKF